MVLAQAIPYAGERIVVVTDGNEHGKDDWAATPLTLALIASKEIQDGKPGNCGEFFQFWISSYP